ncbi:hypothetical protein GF358_01035 [Candidatus Woesearchaeota archaeon]|nr:hypothetical protein [Candidatus Woesearchaeota archaeon]
MKTATNLIYRGDCHSVLKRNFPENCVNLIYMDPPFSFNPKYAKLWYDKETLQMFEEIRKGSVKHYTAWISKRIEQAHRVLKNTGSIYLHCDWKFGHYIKVEMDNIFGKNNFQDEIIWHYSVGGKSQKRWGRKHDTIFFYTKSKKWTFNKKHAKVEPRKTGSKSFGGRIGTDENGRPYQDKIAKSGKIYRYYLDEGRIHDVWEIQPIQSQDKKRTGYFTQKPDELLERIIKVSSNPKDIVLDLMCGCGTTLAVSHSLRRQWIGIDISSQACEVIKQRMEGLEGINKVEIRGLPLTIKDLKKLGGFEFEDYICDMTNSVKTKHTSDKGIDGYHLGETPLQIKQQERVGRKVVDEFETALRRKNKNHGNIIAFSFTKGAYEETARARDDGLDIELIKMSELIKADYDLETLLE